MFFRKFKFFALSTALVLSGCDREAQMPGSNPPSDTRPNILLIVADDVGYSDVGVFGSEIATPNIDALAAEGVMLTQFHVFPNCGPTRGAMMTGVDPHRAGLGGNHGAMAENQEGKPGYEGHLRDDVVSLAQPLRATDGRPRRADSGELSGVSRTPVRRLACRPGRRSGQCQAPSR